jgi:hypothetical protein
MDGLWTPARWDGCRARRCDGISGIPRQDGVPHSHHLDKIGRGCN